jgi:hypothetical protein
MSESSDGDDEFSKSRAVCELIKTNFYVYAKPCVILKLGLGDRQ